MFEVLMAVVLLAVLAAAGLAVTLTAERFLPHHDKPAEPAPSDAQAAPDSDAR